MKIEIERKFLVKGTPWTGLQGLPMQQGYLTNGSCTVRVRTTAAKAWLTIKGTTTGISRPEFEYEIPVAEARDMLNTFCAVARIVKTRYLVIYKGFTWEIDVFAGQNDGLVLAEVELASEDTAVPLPPWAGKEVSYDPRFRNSYLLSNPWPFAL